MRYPRRARKDAARDSPIAPSVLRGSSSEFLDRGSVLADFLARCEPPADEVFAFGLNLGFSNNGVASPGPGKAEHSGWESCAL